MGRTLTAVLVSLAGIVFYYSFLSGGPPPIPEIDLEEWWGSALAKSKQDTSIKPFKVEFSDTMIKDLKDRLRDRHPLTPPLEGIAFEYGFNSKQLEGWLKYWAEEYPFKERQEFFNKYPHFKTNIQGLDIHFIRVTPDVPAGVEVVPMLILHGWPGSVREFYEAIPHLTAVSKDRDFAIEVIVASLPGYGFSSAAVRPGLGVDKMAVVFRNLMQRLGYKKYYVQGQDWGGLITSIMVTFFPEEILGYHTPTPFLQTAKSTTITLLASYFPSLIVAPELQDRVYPQSEIWSNLIAEAGYMHLHATKPDTIGVALSDSPAGLAAYILEKFSTWTKMSHRSVPDGGLIKHFGREKLIDHLMVFWSTNSIMTSVRLYAESVNKRYMALNIDEIPTTVPTSVIQSKHELSYTPHFALKEKYQNLVHETILDDGGHFLAFELPEIFSKDVINAVKNFREWHKKNK